MKSENCISRSIYLPKEDYAKVEEIAKKKCMGSSDIIRIAIKEYIIKHTTNASK